MSEIKQDCRLKYAEVEAQTLREMYLLLLYNVQGTLDTWIELLKYFVDGRINSFWSPIDERDRGASEQMSNERVKFILCPATLATGY